jgi:hypothetical protein
MDAMHVEMVAALDGDWVRLAPVKVGRDAREGAAPSRFVLVSSAGAPVLRIDLYESGEPECRAFEATELWAPWVVVGYGHWVHLISVESKQVTSFDLGAYFGHLYFFEDSLFVASCDYVFRIARDAALLWRSEQVGLDGVLISEISTEQLEGSGEWDPPGGWRPFCISAKTGKRT